MGMKIPVTEHHADGTVTHSEFEMSDEMTAEWEAARADEQRRLAEGRQTYWCHCEDVDVMAAMNSGEAYWKDDTRTGMHRKHGIIHRPCGGYLQEG